MTAISQGRILKELVKGAVIRVEYINHPPSSARRIYRLIPSNHQLRQDQVERLLEDRLIRPNADGLFGQDGPAQSYVLFRASEGGA